MRWFSVAVVWRRTFVFFFFQAEDGIRDIGVTGVQTCALPILSVAAAALARPGSQELPQGYAVPLGPPAAASHSASVGSRAAASRHWQNACASAQRTPVTGQFAAGCSVHGAAAWVAARNGA